MDPGPTRHERRVGPEAAGERLDRWLTLELDGLSRSRIQALIGEGRVHVDGRAVPSRTRLRGGERVEIEIPVPVEVALAADPRVPFEIRFEDEDLAVIDKPAGIVVHPAPGHREGTLVHGLLARLTGLSAVGGRARPGIVHRLDRDTSGLMVVAKNDRAHRHLQDQLRERTLGRVYDALVWGGPEPPRDRIDLPLDRDPRDRKRRAVVAGGRRAITDYRTVERLEGATHLRLRLLTGRTHQIRVHLAHRGHPVLADRIYGGGPERLTGAHPPHRPGLAAALAALPRQALHASSLRLLHPSSGRELRVDSPLPEALTAALELLRGSGVR